MFNFPSLFKGSNSSFEMVWLVVVRGGACKCDEVRVFFSTLRRPDYLFSLRPWPEYSFSACSKSDTKTTPPPINEMVVP